MKASLILIISLCFLITIKAQTTFSSKKDIIISTGELHSVHSCDVDGDGDYDVLSVYSDKIAWHKNIDGLGAFGTGHTITTAVTNAENVYTCDLDGDGDLDVLSASIQDDKIAWYENLDGLGTFGSQQVITTEANAATDVYASDLDGDGDMDVLSASFQDDKIAWYENTDGNGTFGSQQIITTEALYAQAVFSCDLDGDGDMDVLSASRTDNKIAWYENTDGFGTFGSQQIITTDAGNATDVYASDLDGDGDMDVLSASQQDNKIAMYVNIDGAGTFSGQVILTTSAAFVQSVYSSDLDGDGDMDVLSASRSDNKIAWYENLDGFGAFGSQQIITDSTGGANDVFSCDLDGDGDMDVLSASRSDNKIAWYENTNSMGTFGLQQLITNVANCPRAVYSCDLDGDGDMDVLSASADDDKIAWYENIDGQGTFGLQQVITTSADYAQDVYAIDLDGDGDMDVLSASYHGDNIAWYENMDGLGTFGSQLLITDSVDGPRSIYACDLDGDGDMDVLSASSQDDKIAWYENTDGLGTFGTQQVITLSANYPESVYAVDLDGDGDMDVLSTSRIYNKIVWYENTDGLGTFGSEQIITTAVNNASDVFASDLDGDGDMDVLSASRSDNKIAWYENTDGLGTFALQVIISNTAYQAQSVYACDLDGDGDIDVLSASEDGDYIAWYENLDGNGTFSLWQIITTDVVHATDVFACDLDGDGDYDVLSASCGDNNIAWYENDPFPTINNQPLNNEICEDQDTVFTIDVAFAIAYQWQVDSGSGFSNIVNDTVYNGATTYSLGVSNIPFIMNGHQYRCIAYSYKDSIISDTALLQVNLLPITSFTVTSPVTTGENTIVSYTGETSSSDSFNWNFDGASSSPSGIGPHNISWPDFGTKTIILEVTNDNGCAFYPISQQVIVNPSSTFNIVSELCAESATNITFTGSATPAGSYTWNFDGGTILSGSGQGPFEVYWDIAGTKNISLEVQEIGYTSVLTSNSIIVNPLPIASFTTMSPVETEENCTVTYTGETSGSDSLNWSFDDATSNPGGIGPHIVNWTTGGLKTITMSVINNNGCSSYPVNEAVEVLPKSIFSLASEVCAEDSIVITYTGTSVDSANYSWDFDGATSSPNGQGPHSLSWDSSGTKTITLTVEENGYTSTQTANVLYVNPLPEITIGDNQYVCLEGTTTIAPSVSNGTPAYAYDWNTGATSTAITVTDVDTHYFLTITDSNGCIAIDTIHTSIFYPYQNQQICLVSYDEQTDKNKIMWNKVEEVGSAYVNIYLEASQDNYIYVDQADINSSSYIDIYSLPNQSPNKYKITVVDTCGNESEIDSCNAHKTILLSITDNSPVSYDLAWSPYEGFSYNKYYIYRGIVEESMILYDSVLSYNTSYSDQTPLSCLMYYKIGVKHTNPCNIECSFSNTVDNGIIISDLQTSIADTGFCTNSEVILDAGGNYTDYSWSNGEFTQYVTINTPGSYTVTVSDSIGCLQGYSDTVIVEEFPLPTPQITIGGDTIMCLGDSTTLAVNEQYESYLWSTLDTTASIVVYESGLYHVTVTDSITCVGGSTDQIISVQTAYQDQQICLVTVDPSVGKNKVIWVGNDNVGIENYVIQKAVGTDDYNPIGTVPYDDTPEFIDYTSDPASHSDIYKITVMDSCGNTSDIDNSVYHKTINLTLSNVGSTMSLNWEEYEVEDGSFIPSKYHIYRGMGAYSLELFDSVIGIIHTYNDIGVYDVYYYMIGAVRNDCNLNKTGEAFSLFSNKEENEDIILSMRELSLHNRLNIYPNPAKDEVTISFENKGNKESNLLITDITGKQLFTSRVNTSEIIIDISSYKPGVYIVELMSDKFYKGKLVIK